ncbi:MAG: hypothetical protein HYR72_19940 [Deltaproteobacteria bacterium]|nr:hypothetical protein [Deltaproteobacteria bacterium]MBI3390851.1 hypothetical protein [Deltaproteobacteria bacterium]
MARTTAAVTKTQTGSTGNGHAHPAINQPSAEPTAGVSQEFEARQLLKAYRKGLISDALFAEQMREIGITAPAGASGKTYQINGRAYASERKMLVSFLDKFRAGEKYASEVLPLWIETCRVPELKGGLRTVCHREFMHSQLLEQRLCELGGELRAAIPDEIRIKARAMLASTALSDGEKLRDFIARNPDVESAIKPIKDVICQIDEDQETKALLQTICDDEAATAGWLRAMCECLTSTSARTNA